MEIGETDETIIVEPLEDPFKPRVLPQENPAPVEAPPELVPA